MVNNSARYIIHYSTNHLSNKDIVRFFYALKGRGNSKGLLEQTNSKQLAKSIIETQTKAIPNWKYFLKKWACKYKFIKIVSKSRATHRIFIFNSSKLTGSAKVRFFYALKGRGKKQGIIEQTNAEYLAKSVILVSIREYFELIKFFQKWGCGFEIKEVSK